MSDIISSELSDDMKNSWGTDPVIFNAINKEFNFSMDAASSNKNKLVPSCFLTKEDDALTVDWLKHMDSLGAKNQNVWVNPPYGKGFIKRFMEKAIKEKAKGVTTVLLVPATLDAQWLPINEISEIRIVTGGRLTFLAPCDYTIKGKNGKPDRLVKEGTAINGNTKGSMFVIFRPSKMPCVIRMVDRNELIALGT